MYDKDLLNAVKTLVSTSIRSNTTRGYIGGHSCDNICMDMNAIIEEAKQNLAKGDAMTSLCIASYIVVTGVKLASSADSSSGMLTMSIEDALALTKECSEYILSHECSELNKNEALDIILKESKKKVFDGWTNWRYDYLRCGICLVDDKSADKFEKYLNTFLEAALNRDYHFYDIQEDKIIRYQLHRHLRGKGSVRDELYANIDIDELRRIAINDALETKNYAEAERLCFEKASDDTWRYRASDPADWNNILFSIYERAGIKEKLISQARKLMLFGNVRFWDILKDIYAKDGVWKDKRGRLLKDASTCRIKSSYYQILQDEQEWNLLLKEMEQEPEEIFAYGSMLIKEYPEEVYSLCIKKIRNEVSYSTERRMYKQVSKLIIQLIKWGGVIPAEQLITELKTEYARRPALIDELSKVERKYF